MSLPAVDQAYLANRETPHSVTVESNMTCVVLPGFVLPPGYDRSQSDLLVRLSPGYPDVPPDMWWFDPPVRLADSRSVQATECIEQYLGRSWQRWSRHLNQGQWRSGVDCLETFLALIRRELERCAAVVAR
jgi:E2/UBC family protein E